jgi:hypothetical protein
VSKKEMENMVGYIEGKIVWNKWVLDGIVNGK